MSRIEWYAEAFRVLDFPSALDDTYIKVNVNVVDRPRYRTRKGNIATNVLAEVFAVDSRVLRDAVSRSYGLRVSKGYYYLCDAGYPNAEEFLAPYRGERYHLSDWCGAGNASTTAREFFNMKHSSTRNVIERAFGFLKGKWVILRRKSFNPIQVQCRTITVYFLIHNLITREMGIGAMLDMPDEKNSASVSLDGDHIEFVESLEEWTKFTDDLAVKIFTQWQRV
ncbi:uncharacterized protein LOC120073613 [Benincasa hispida]|uniref:uncharacterized protein LOC120073613 n=1 Tax=Benincasa hispida TaxID=102211 RepID=UPI0019023397|nr:uncharacterized protein LOC120073613 [Benincasa hispida]